MELLAPLSGPDGVVEILETAEIMGFAFEGNLGSPFSGALILIDSGAATCIGDAEFFFPALQDGDGSAVHQAEIVDDGLFLQAAAAFGLSGLEEGLTDDGLFSAVAQTAPAMHTGTLAGVGGDHQTAETAADVFLERGMGPAATAFGIAIQKLVGRDEGIVAAVALTAPDDAAVLPAVGHRQGNKPAEAAAGEVQGAGGNFGDTATVPDGASLKSPGVQKAMASAVTSAIPDGVAIAALAGLSDDFQTTDTAAGDDLWI